MQRTLAIVFGGIIGVSALTGAIGFSAFPSIISETLEVSTEELFVAVFEPAIDMATSLSFSDVTADEMYARPSIWVFIILGQYICLYVVAAIILGICRVVAGRLGATVATVLLAVPIAIYGFSFAAILPPLAGNFGVEVLPQILLAATTILLGSITGVFLGSTAGAAIGDSRRKSKLKAAAKRTNDLNSPFLEPVTGADHHDPYVSDQQRDPSHPRRRLAIIIGGLTGIFALLGTVLGSAYGYFAGAIYEVAFTAVVNDIFSPSLTNALNLNTLAKETMFWTFEILYIYFGLYISAIVLVLAGKGLAGRKGAIAAFILETITFALSAAAFGVMPSFAGGLGLGILEQMLLAATNIVLAVIAGTVMGATAGAIIGTGAAKNK